MVVRMDDHRALLEGNRRWADGVLAGDPEFFTRLSRQQSPAYFWIGCSDSRVPATEITGMAPGAIFVHRNIANLVLQPDLNFLSVLQYAVDTLQVRHVIVCGHYGCGGVQAAFDGKQFGLIDNWLQPIRRLLRDHADELATLDPGAAVNRLCELNVIEQVANVARTAAVEQAWRRGQPLQIHGLIYRLDDGRLQELVGPVDQPV